MKLLKSSRFQGLIAIAFLQSLVLFSVITTEQGAGLIQIIQSLIGAAIVIRTADKNLGKVK